MSLAALQKSGLVGGGGRRKHWEVGTGVEGMTTKERDGFKFPNLEIIKAMVGLSTVGNRTRGFMKQDNDLDFPFLLTS